MADSYLPPVVIDILGTADSFTRTVQYVKAQLKSLSGDRGDPKILATDTDFEAKVATVTTTLKTVSKMVAKPKIIPTTDAVTNAVVMTTAAWQSLNEMIARPLIEPRVDMTALSALLGSASSRALMPGHQMLALPPGEMGLMQYIPPGGLMPYGGQTGGGQDWAYYAAAAAAANAGGGGSSGPGFLGGLLGGGAAGGGGGGGGGAGLLAALMGGKTGKGGNGIFGMLGGLPAFGSLLSLMGFGAEHVAATGIGIGGSLLGAGIGGGLLGLGMGGTAAVGMGTDMAGMGQAMNDIKLYRTALNALNTAIATYGANSAQAAAAQNHLNYVLSTFPPQAQSGIVALSNTLTQLGTAFNKATGAAEAGALKIFTSLVKASETFLPTIGKFAAENMGIIQKSLAPFLKWLQTAHVGGLKIFTNLEKVFQHELPTGMHALEQGFELLAKTITIASKYGGRFVTWINEFLTKMNGATFGKWAKFVNDMIASFNDWFGLLKSAAKMVFALFQPAVGLGDQIAKLLSTIFGQITGWLKGSHTLLHGLFTAHAKELIQGIGGIIKQVLPLVESFGSAFVTFATGGALVAETVLRGIASALLLINKIPFASTILGWGAAVAFFAPKVVTGFTAAVKWVELLPTRAGVAILNFRQSLGTAASAVTRFATGIGKGLMTGVQAIGSFVASAASAAGRFVVSAAQMVASSAMATAAFIKNFAVSAAGWVATGAEAVASAAVQVGAWIATAAAATAAFIAENAATLGIIAGLAALVAGVVWMATHWHQVWTDIKNWFDDAVKFLRSGLGTLVLALAGPVGAALLLALHWHQVWDDIKQWAADAWHFLDGIWHDMVAGTESAISTIVGFVESIPAKIIGVFSSAGHWLVDAGKAIIDGLVHGVMGAVGAAVHAVKSVGSTIVGAVKSFFGILSPSTLFAEIGRNLMLGLGYGVLQAAPMATASMNQAMLGTLNAARSASMLMPFGGAGFGAYGSPSMVNTITNHVVVQTAPGASNGQTKASVQQALDASNQKVIQQLRAGVYRTS